MDTDGEFNDKYNEFHNKILDSIEESKEFFGPSQVASMLINLGVDLCLKCAPSEEGAMEVVHKTIKIAVDSHFKNKDE